MNKIRLIKIILPIAIVIISSFLSCVEEYWPEIKDDDNKLLVVEGKITNEPGPYTVFLSNPRSLLDSIYHPLANAQVMIEDDEGTSEVLSELSPGIYVSSENGIQGEIGKKYRVRIYYRGKSYESAFEELLDPVGIESVISQEEVLLGDIPENDEKGIQFYVTSQTAINDVNYFYWELDETFEFHSPYPMEYYYSGELIQAEDRYELYYCWNTKSVKEIFTQSTENLTMPKITDLSLSFMPFSDERIKIKYSLLVKQLMISKKAYTFYKGLEDQNSSQDNIYARQPYQIRGNIVNIDDPSESVLGYFLTAGVSKKRVFAYPKAVTPHKDWSMRNCIVLSGGAGNSIQDVINITSPSEWPLYLAKAWLMVPMSNPVIMRKSLNVVEKSCVDCRLHGGVLQKPDYWDE